MIYLGYAKSGREFEVTQDLADIGIDAWCGKAIEWRRTGKKKYPEAFEVVALPNYLVIEMTANQFLDALEVKYLASTLMMVSDAEMKGKTDWVDVNGIEHKGRKGVRHFMDAVDGKYVEDDKLRQRYEKLREQQASREAMRAIREEIARKVFSPGQQLDIIGGPFAEKLGTFRRLVENTHEFHPKLEVEINGRPVQLDPLDVKAAE